MVSEITSGGAPEPRPRRGMNPNNAEAENCRIVTRSGNVYTGTFQLRNASIHVNGEYNNTKRAYSEMEVLLDEVVRTKEDVLASVFCPAILSALNPAQW